MARKIFRYNYLYMFSFFIVFVIMFSFFIVFVILYRHLLQNDSSVLFTDQFYPTTVTSSVANLVLRENFPSSSFPIPFVSILMPDWEIYVIVSPDYSPLRTHLPGSSFYCVFDIGEETPAVPAAELPFPARSVFKCNFPERARRSLPFKQPMLRGSSVNGFNRNSPSPELVRWDFLVYDSLTTDEDVVLFVKGLNKRRGINREPTEFNCIFGDAVRTAVTSSIQEVFRCKLPDHFAGKEPTRVSIEIAGPTPVVVPTIAYYTPPRKISISSQQKAKLCACTMVYNVAKFLREWVLYHSRIGVEKFILYDNGSDDDLATIVDEIVEEGYDVKAHLWLWPKTQEGGFSHSVIFAKDACSWMIYIDIDEFVYSPSWSNLTQPSPSLLPSMLSKLEEEENNVAQIIIPCYEFGPSNRKEHPTTGVIQGYNCRMKNENRHKSIVLLSSVDDSLLNVIHHFKLKTGYNVKILNVHEMVVNHYKYQAWPEFKAKFRRRVSTYVVDWTKPSNLGSNDRTPGLGFSAIEPIGWKSKFCEVYDNRLKDLTWRWLTIESLPSSMYSRP